MTKFSTFSNWAAIVNVGVAALKGFIRDYVGHQHFALEVNSIGARRNADGLEFAPHAVITDTAGFLIAGNEMQLPASLAHNPIPNWHPAIMLRVEWSTFRNDDISPFHSFESVRFPYRFVVEKEF